MHRLINYSLTEDGKGISAPNTNELAVVRGKTDCTFVHSGTNVDVRPVGKRPWDNSHTCFGGISVNSSCPSASGKSIERLPGDGGVLIEVNGQIYLNFPSKLEEVDGERVVDREIRVRAFRCWRAPVADLASAGPYNVKWDSDPPRKNVSHVNRSTHGVIYPTETVRLESVGKNSRTGTLDGLFPGIAKLQWVLCKHLLLTTEEHYAWLRGAGDRPDDHPFEDDNTEQLVRALHKQGQDGNDLLTEALPAWALVCWCREQSRDVDIPQLLSRADCPPEAALTALIALEQQMQLADACDFVLYQETIDVVKQHMAEVEQRRQWVKQQKRSLSSLSQSFRSKSASPHASAGTLLINTYAQNPWSQRFSAAFKLASTGELEAAFTNVATLFNFGGIKTFSLAGGGTIPDLCWAVIQHGRLRLGILANAPSWSVIIWSGWTKEDEVHDQSSLWDTRPPQEDVLRVCQTQFLV
jgi:hypothetical protein